jgi:hypothetical protein
LKFLSRTQEIGVNAESALIYRATRDQECLQWDDGRQGKMPKLSDEELKQKEAATLGARLQAACLCGL